MLTDEGASWSRLYWSLWFLRLRCEKQHLAAPSAADADADGAASVLDRQRDHDLPGCSHGADADTAGAEVAPLADAGLHMHCDPSSEPVSFALAAPAPSLAHGASASPDLASARPPLSHTAVSMAASAGAAAANDCSGTLPAQQGEHSDEPAQQRPDTDPDSSQLAAPATDDVGPLFKELDEDAVVALHREARKLVELMCAPLVHSRQGSLLLQHLSCANSTRQECLVSYSPSLPEAGLCFSACACMRRHYARCMY